MEWIHFLIAGLTGACLGSFCSVLVCRIPLGESVILGRSRCRYCNHVLSGYELIPIVSFVLQGACCRACGNSISWKYPLREVVLGGVCVILFSVFGWSLDFVRFSLLAILLVSISEIDYLHGIVPNQLVIAGIAMGSILLLFDGWYTLLLATLASTTTFALLMIVREGSLLLFGRRGLGMGDVKLIAMLSFFIGWYSVWAFYLATLIGGLVGLYGIATGRLYRTTRLPFAPFITSGVVGAAFLYPLDVLSWLFL